MDDRLQLRFEITSEDAVKGVEAVNTALGKTKAVTTTVNTAVGELTGALKDKLGPAGEAANAAFTKMSNVTGIRGLSMAIVQAQIAMDAFKKAAQDAEASGTKMPASVKLSLVMMQTELAAATNKLGTTKNAMGDVVVQSRAMAEGWKQAASAGGSMTSMMSNLAEGTTGLGSSLAKVTLGVGGVVAAFKVGYTSGREFVGFMKNFGVDIDKGATTALTKFAGVLAKLGLEDKARQYLIDLSNSTKGYGDLLTPLEGKMNAQMKAHAALSKEIQAADKVLKDLGIEYHTAGEAGETLDKKIAALAIRFHDATKAGETLGGMAKANAAQLDILQKAVDDGTVKWSSLDDTMRKVLASHQELPPVLNTLTGGLQSLTAVNKAYEQSLKDIAAAASNMAKAIADEKAAFDAHTLAINTATISTTEAAAAWGASMSNISKTTAQAKIEMADLPKDMHDAATAALAAADAFGRTADGLTEIKLAGDQAAAGLVGVAWEMRKATPVVVTLNDSQNALVESLAKVSDQYGKTSLWVGHLLSQFEKGTVSLSDFRKQLADMLMGMRAMPGAFGDTSIQLHTMLSLLDKFKNEASNGWPVGKTTAPYATTTNTLGTGLRP